MGVKGRWIIDHPLPISHKFIACAKVGVLAYPRTIITKDKRICYKYIKACKLFDQPHD